MQGGRPALRRIAQAMLAATVKPDLTVGAVVALDAASRDAHLEIVREKDATIETLRASLAAAEKERDEADAGAEAIEAKFATLCLVGRDCGCSYDHKDHVCMYHSPQLVAAIERAEKAEAERDAARWQPIETAPRDGTRLWCFWPDAEPEERQAIGWFVSYGEDEYWTDAADSDPNPPTHWMPLPAAPANLEDPARD